jgi:hypothetical protein
MSPRLAKLPNHQAKFIIVDEQVSLLGSSKSNKILNDTIGRKDETLYYYLKLPKLKDERQYLKFLKELVTDSYNRDFFDRNTTSINFQENDVTFSCESIADLNIYFSKIIVPQNSHLLKCGEEFLLPNDNKINSYRTAIRYEPVTIQELERKREDYKVKSQLHSWEGNIFMTLSFGQHSIDRNSQTRFDEETLVDISEANSIWHFTSGYMFTRKIGALVNFGLMSSQEQTAGSSGNSNQITISGSGNGFGILQLGIGARYIPFTHKNWSVYTDLHGGILNVRVKGGYTNVTFTNGVERSTREISEKTEKSNYLGFALGANYRLGGLVYLTSNFQYTVSNFENDIGSISGFTGYAVNLGIGFSFK